MNPFPTKVADEPPKIGRTARRSAVRKRPRRSTGFPR